MYGHPPDKNNCMKNEARDEGTYFHTFLAFLHTLLSLSDGRKIYQHFSNMSTWGLNHKQIIEHIQIVTQ